MSHSCPDCGHLMGIEFRPLSGGIGPTHYRCRSCDGVAHSGKVEWHRLSRRQRQAYTRASAIYAILICAICTFGLNFGIIQIGQPPLSYLWLGLLAGSVMTGVIAIQAGRVMFSIRRDTRGDIRPINASFFSIDVNGSLLLFVPVLVGLAVGLAGLKLGS